MGLYSASLVAAEVFAVPFLSKKYNCSSESDSSSCFVQLKILLSSNKTLAVPVKNSPAICEKVLPPSANSFTDSWLVLSLLNTLSGSKSLNTWGPISFITLVMFCDNFSLNSRKLAVLSGSTSATYKGRSDLYEENLIRSYNLILKQYIHITNLNTSTPFSAKRIDA